MSVKEIEEAIKQLSASEFDQISDWILEVKSIKTNNGERNLQEPSTPRTLADAMGDLLGCLGDPNGELRSSRNAGESFTDYLVIKKREGTL